MADGSIRINTKIDTSGATADLKKLEKECEKTAEKIKEASKKVNTFFTGMSGSQLTGAFHKANRELEKTQAELEKVTSEIEAIQAETDKMLPEAKTDDQTVNLLNMEAEQTKELVEKRDELTEKANEYKKQLETITAELKRQEEAEVQIKMEKTSGAELKQAKSDEDFLSSIGSEEEYTAVLDAVQSRMAQIDSLAASIAQKNGISKEALLQQDAEYSTLQRRLELLQNSQSRYAGKVRESEKETRKLGKEAQKTGDKIRTSMNQGIKRMARMAIGILGIRSAFMLLRRAASAYLESNEELSNQLDSIWNVLGTAIGPAIEQLVNWLAVAITYINALVLALTGVNIIAKANEAALNRQAKAAAKARRTAGFDEQTKLSDSGSSASQNSGIFTPADIDTSGAEKLSEILREIAPLIAGIAAGLLTFNILTDIGVPLATAAQWFLVIAGAVTTITAFIDALKNGIDWENLGQMVIGIGVTVAGLALLFGLTAAAIGLCVGGILLLVAGFKSWIDDGKSLEALTAIELGILAIGVAIALLTGSWIPLVIAAVAGAVVACLMYGDEIAAWLKQAGNDVKGFFDHIGDVVWQFFYDIGKYVEQAGALGSLLSIIIIAVGGVVETVIKFIGNLIKSIISIVRAVVKTVQAIGTGDWSAAWKAWVDAFKDIWDMIKGIVVGVVNIIIDVINVLIRAMNKIQFSVPDWVPGIGGKSVGVNIKEISRIKLAKGGIVNNPGRGVPVTVGEAGKEAVLPLENNTEWMDALAEKINGAGGKQIVIQLMLSGKKIYEEIVDLKNKREFATNGAV